MLDVCANTVSNGNGQQPSVSNGDKKKLQLPTSNDGAIVSHGEDPLSSFVPLVDKIHRYIQGSHDGPFFSVEFFPPRTEKGASNLIQLLDKYREGDPFFCDITWHAAGNPGVETPTSSITIASIALNYCCLNTMLHLTCIGLTKAKLRQHLERAKRLGIRSILALRGDKHENCKIYDFEYASDLVRFIREEYGNYFTIVVAGYPVPHPEADSKQHDLECLKKKVDAGADLVITQLFFEVDDYIDFVANCREIGITVPIIPGICAINNYQSMLKFASLSAVPIPERVLCDLEPIKANDEAVRNYGVHLLVTMCRKLIETNLSPGLHFYTLNQDTVIRVIKALGLWKKLEIRVLPWKMATHYRRVGEATRSVFWINRPKTYIHRTVHWKEYPRAFWSASFSNQISDSLENYYGFLEVANKKEELDQFLCDQPSLMDLYQVFYSYFAKYSTNFDSSAGPTAHKSISILPWIQQANTHFLESAFLHYGQYITSGIIITNYLPCFNAISSEDWRYGWGEANGYLYQKEYLEFFVAPSHLDRLKCILQQSKCVSYHITNRSGSVRVTNWPQHHPITISWGLFPSYQLIPAYVADLKSFDVWRAETFGLFAGWLDLYHSDSGPYRLIKRVQDDYLLVSVIDNQFVSAEAGFKHIFDQLLAR